MVSMGEGDLVSPVIKEIKYDQNYMNLDVDISGRIISRVDTDQIKKALLGKSKSAAESYLATLSSASGYDINYYPSWWLKRIPSLGRNVKVELDYIEENPAQPVEPPPSLVPTAEVSP